MAWYRCGGDGGSGGNDFDYCAVVLNNGIKERKPEWGSCYNIFYSSFMNLPVTIGNMVNNCDNMFSRASEFNQPITIPNNVITMENMFCYAYAFNQPITLHEANVYNYNMQNMFRRCSNFNQPLTIYDSAYNTNCESMLDGCTNFDADITIVSNNSSYYQTRYLQLTNLLNGCYNFKSNVIFDVDENNCHIYCDGMFMNCSNFNRPFTLPNAYYFYNMFNGCTKFDQPIILPQKTIGIGYMFFDCTSFSQDITLSENVNDCRYTFFNCTNFKGNVIFEGIHNRLDAACMFRNCPNFNYPIEINVQGQFYGQGMFSNCNNFNSSVIINANNTSFCNLAEMFNGCSNYSSDFTFQNTNNIYAYGLFYNLPLFNGNVTIQSNNNTYISYLLYNCQNFDATVSISGNNINAYYMLYNCTKFSGKFNFDTCLTFVSCDSMFMNCTNYNPTNPIYLNFTSSGYGYGIGACGNMFRGCTNFNVDVHLGYKVSNISNMFRGCTNFGANVYIDNSSLYSYYIDNMMLDTNNSLVKNIFCNNIEVLKNNVMYPKLTWTDITNGCYNEATNIYLYNNYSPT